MKTISRCLNCRKWMTTTEMKDNGDWTERLKYCTDCWQNKLNKTVSAADVERNIEAERTQFDKWDERNN